MPTIKEEPPESFVHVLRRSQFLEGIGEDVLLALSTHCATMEFDSGDIVVEKGRTDTNMFFIISGKLRVHDDDTYLATLRQGDVFGEMALLDYEARSATVTAESKSRLLSLERDDFYAALRSSPRSFEPLIAAIVRRERAIVEEITERSEKLYAYQKEMDIARKIQSDFLPETIPDIDGWQIAAMFESAKDVAGDFYDIHLLSEDRKCAFVIGDVCDKGVGAALFMTLFRSLLRATTIREHAGLTRNRFAGNKAAETLVRSVRQTNRYIAETHARSAMFATLFFAILDPRTGQLDYVNAGHEPPILFRYGDTPETLAPTGGVVGLFETLEYETSQTRINPQDLLLVYTDGVNEARNPADDQFSKERIGAAVLNSNGSPQAVVKAVYEDLKTFRSGAEQSDDITMFALRREPETSSVPGPG